MKEFIKYLEAKNHSKTTRETYLRYISSFLKWYGADLFNCTKKDIIKYLQYLENNKEHANRTRSLALNALKHYFTYLYASGQTISNPANLLNIRGTHKRTLYNIYTPDQLNAIYDNYHVLYIQNYDDSHIPQKLRYDFSLCRQRNHVILGIFLYQGIVTSELNKIALDDVDLNRAVIKIKAGRKSNERNIPLQAAQIGPLINYINTVRPQLLEKYNSSSNALFLPMLDNNANATYNKPLAGVLYALAKQVKSLDENFVNFKQIRASAITHWLQTEGLRKAQYLAGHRYISSTENYLPNNLEGLIDDVAKFNPF